MIVENYMTKDVITLKPGDTLQNAKKTMKNRHIRHIPVISDDEKLVGIISDRDIRKYTPTPVAARKEDCDEEFMQTKVVEEAMTTHPVSTTPGTPIEEAVTLMRDEKIGALPVVSDGRLVGIITEADIFNAFTDLLRILKRKGITMEQLK